MQAVEAWETATDPGTARPNPGLPAAGTRNGHPGQCAGRHAPCPQILVTRVGLQMPADLPYEDWENAGGKLARISDTSAWCLGDWIVHGQERFRDRYRCAVKNAGLDYQTLRNYAWVARKFPQGLAGLPQLPEELSGAVHASEGVHA